MADFKLIPISKDAWEWQCSVLKLGGATVLLDCGWDEAMDPRSLSPLVPHLGDLDLILLSHADFKHVGALPYLLTKYHISCPIICTEPVCRLGELSCVACLEDREKYQAPTEHFTVDDVLRTFMSRVTPLSYRETFYTQVRGRSLAACPYPAGHHIGGACWTVQCGGLSAVYFVDGEVRRNRFLDGLEVQRLTPAARGAAQPWDVLITSPLPTMDALPQLGADQEPQEAAVPTKALTVARSVRDQLFLEGTIATLRHGGSVLIPADVAGFIPELLLLLDAAWEQDRQLFTNYPLVWLSSMGDMVLDQIKTRLEWMSKEVLEKFEQRVGSHPFMLKNVRILQSLEELCSAHPLSRPKVIVATSQSLEGGDARELFMRMCGDPRTLLWLLGFPARGTLARQLLDDFVLKHATRKEYRLQQHYKVPLPEEQLRAYYESKILELTESGQKVPPELAQFKSEIEDLARVKLEGDAPPDASPPPLDEPVDAAPASAAAPVAPSAEKLGVPRRAPAAGSLWTPLGWSSSRTVAHSDVRNEGDEYGHLLAPTEMTVWKAQDQGSDAYGLAAAEGDADVAESALAGKVKEELLIKREELFLKQEEEAMDALADWRDSLRVHFSEPMRAEVRELTLRVGCRTRFLPDTLMDPTDLCMIVRATAPKHVVLLPTADDLPTGRTLAAYLRVCNPERPTATMPRLHVLSGAERELQLSLRVPKRRLQFSSELWPKLSFLKAKDGMRIAPVRASMPVVAAPTGPVEVGVCRDRPPAAAPTAPPIGGSPDAAGGAESEEASSAAAPPAEGAGLAAEERLPRDGVLFVPLGDEPLALSTLKDQLLRHEWTRDVPVEFHAPKPQPGRPWTTRLLVAGDKAVLGWASAPWGGADRAAAGTVAGAGAAGGAPGADGAALGADAAGGAGGAGARKAATPPVLRLEGVPSEEFFAARAALYKRCALV